MPNTGFLGWAYISGSAATHMEASDKWVTFYSGSAPTRVLTGSKDFYFDYDNKNLVLTGNLQVSGAIKSYSFETITELNTIHSGSSKFGNDTTDVHQFTGSVEISGAATSALTVLSGNVVFNEIGDKNDFRVETDGNTHMLYVDGTNNRVGIGTDSPAKNLHINGASGEVELRIQSNNKLSSIVQKDNAELIIQNASNGPIIFYDDTAERVRITNDGKVGIGVSDPDSQLEISGTSTQLKLSNNADDYATFAVGTHGDLAITTVDAAAAAANIQITADGTAELAGTTVTLDSGGSVVLDADGAVDINAATGVTIDGTTLSIDGTDTANLTMTANAASTKTMTISATNSDGSNVSNIDVDADGTLTLNGAAGATFGDDTEAIVYDGSGNLDVDAVALDLDVTDSSSITITSSEAAEDLTIAQVGANDSSIIITAAGTGADAISIDATAGSMVIAPSLADQKTLKLGKNGAVEVIIAPHDTAASEKFTVTNTAGTAADAIGFVATAGGITLQSDGGTLINCPDGGTDFRIVSSADTGDYFQIATTTHGATTITTVDDDATAANLTFTVDGDIILGPAGGDVLPDTDNTRNLGSGSKRWANVYTGDLHLKNDRGDWTILEEEDYLCVVNNMTGKKYKMMLQEIED
tara:strand:+ start:166 stop:2091 length:1926 start_codon:yes stop_codon:yes gene_type:complete